MKTNVVFEYAGENMETVHDKVAVTGEITECGFAVMMAATNRDGAFVPATVGLRKVNYAKLVGVEPCEADSVAVCSADVLVGRFVNASGAWDELSSNRQVQSGAVRVGIPFVYGLYNFTPVRNGANKKISWWISREGIGHALYEIVEHDDRGRLRTGNFMSYKLPTRLDIGSIRVAFEPSYEPTGPFGAKSIGEVVINTPLAAVASAVAHATGHQVRSLPITPEKALLGE